MDFSLKWLYFPFVKLIFMILLEKLFVKKKKKRKKTLNKVSNLRKLFYLTKMPIFQNI